MSTPGLKKIADRALSRLTVKLRKEVEGYTGQLFIFDEAGQRAHLTELGLSPSDVNIFIKEYRKRLTTAEAYFMSRYKRDYNRVDAHREAIQAREIVPGFRSTKHKLYAVTNYQTVSRIKTEMGKFFVTYFGGKMEDITGKGGKAGHHVGHGQFGHAVSTTKVLGAEAVLYSGAAKRYKETALYKKLLGHIETYKIRSKISLDIEHYQEINADGTFKKKYTPILSNQRASENMEASKGKDGETQTLLDLVASVKEAINDPVNAKASKSMKEAIEDAMLHNISKSKKARTSRKKPGPKSKSKTKAKANSAVTSKGKASKGGTAIKKQQVEKQKSLFNLLAIINARLPEVVAGNMGSPRLNYRTGRFANSTRAVSIDTTAGGYPSIAYTYMLYPYQTFEPGYAQGSADRDPRKLIDLSIREIAVQFALGRFYTRRV
jgi:hypothetical protein